MFFKILSLFFYRSKRTYSVRHTYAVWDSHTDKLIQNSNDFNQVESLVSGRVLQVLDGDTVVISVFNKPVKVRLDSIDCPEDGQTWGDISKFGLIKLIGGSKVYLEPYGIDQYSRTLATIFVKDPFKNEWMNVNERMVTLGHAWVMRRYYDHLPPDRKAKLNSLERWSRSKKIGLWRQENPIPPWEWRNN